MDTSKQAIHSKLDRHLLKQDELWQIELIVRQVRKDHPRMGLRDLYLIIAPETIGRDAFIKHFSGLGYGVGHVRSFKRTTNSLGVTRFENLIENLELTGVNHVWVSDITYYRLGERFYYITFIMDLYSRKIAGYSLSVNLTTEHTTLPALLMALRVRKASKLKGLIFHSDGGGQYYSKAFLKVTRKAKMINSMAKDVYENPHAERVNGIIKNNYVIPYGPTNYKQLSKALEKAVYMYNEQKPHKALNKLSPNQFETLINKNQLMNKEKKKQKKKDYIINNKFV